MKASRLWRAISRLRNVLEGSIKAQIEGIDVNIYISNQGVHTSNVELRYVVLKLRKKCSFSKKEKCFWRAISWLTLEMS